jgi:hypothetical protein
MLALFVPEETALAPKPSSDLGRSHSLDEARRTVAIPENPFKPAI